MDPIMNLAFSSTEEQNQSRGDVRTDARRMDHRRLTSAVVIHAMAFLVAVVSLGSGSGSGFGIGASVVTGGAGIKVDRVGRKPPVQAFGIEGRQSNQVLRFLNHLQPLGEENPDSAGAVETIVVEPSSVSHLDDGVIAVQYQSSQQ